jgi:hypothetical protein
VMGGALKAPLLVLPVPRAKRSVGLGAACAEFHSLNLPWLPTQAALDRPPVNGAYQGMLGGTCHAHSGGLAKKASRLCVNRALSCRRRGPAGRADVSATCFDAYVEMG